MKTKTLLGINHILYVVPADTRAKPYFTKIIKIGKKYIYTSSYDKFDINTLYSADDAQGLNPRLQAYLSIQDYVIRSTKEDLYKELVKKLQSLKDELSVSIIRVIMDFLTESSKQSDNGIKYVREDAFIEKASIYIANHFLVPGMDSEIDSFVNYMKGE